MPPNNKSRGVFAFFRRIRDTFRGRESSKKMLQDGPAPLYVVSSSPASSRTPVVTTAAVVSSKKKARTEKTLLKMDEKDLGFMSDYVTVAQLAKTKIHQPELIRIVAEFMWDKEDYVNIGHNNSQTIMTRNARVFIDAMRSNPVIATRWGKFVVHASVAEEAAIWCKLTSRVRIWKKSWIHSSGDLFCGTCAGATCTTIRTTAEGFVTEFERLASTVHFPPGQLEAAKDKVMRRNNAKFDSTCFDEPMLSLVCAFTATEMYRRFALTAHAVLPLEL